MNLELPKNLTSRVKGFSPLCFFRRVSRYILWIIFLGTVSWIGYLWYSSLYNFEWTEEQKNSYRSEYAGETSFRAERFTSTVNILKERIRLHQAAPLVQKDIFTGGGF